MKVNSDIEVLSFPDVTIYVSRLNGNTICLENGCNKSVSQIEKLFKDNLFNLNPVIPNHYDDALFKTVYISLHASSSCNLRCSYCFKESRDLNDLTFSEAKCFIDMIVSEFPNAGKFIVDPTGSGEPLLNIELIVEIGNYCKIKSNEIKKEVLPMLVTNGTLLDDETVIMLRESGILFGVSIDGDKKSNDFYRKNNLGEGVYKKVIKNVKKIKDKTLLGAAVTLTDKNIDIVSNLKHLSKHFPTISIKPVRSLDGNCGLNDKNIEAIKKSYTDLHNFVLKHTIDGNLKYISALLNGDDYFGKFILRAFLDAKVITRCDAGIGRFSLSSNKNIYVCPGAVDIDELIVGSLDTGINKSRVDEIWSILVKREACSNCYARFICGGTCLVSSYYQNGTIDKLDDITCKLNKHLYNLAVHIKYVLSTSKYFDVILRGCVEKAGRFDEDLELKEKLDKLGTMSFTDLKKIKDNNYEEFKKM